MTEKPDLPILENVSASLSSETDYTSAARKNLKYIMLKLFLSFLVVLWLWFNLTHKHPADFTEDLVRYMWPLLLVITGFMTIGGCALLSPFYWETSSEGILARGYLGSKLIRWNDIIKTRTSQWIIGTVFVSRRGSFLIPDVTLNWTARLLGASIWQYLRREGKADVYEMPYSANLLWNEPKMETAEWKLPRPTGTYLLYIFLSIQLLFFFGTILYMLIDQKFKPLALLIALVVLAALAWVVRYFYKDHLRRVKLVEVTEDVIRLTTAGETVELHPCNIGYIDWTLNQFHIGSCKENSFTIPYKDYFTESKKVILAIVKRLSAIEHPQLLSIPEDIIRPPIPPLTGDWNDEPFKK